MLAKSLKVWLVVEIKTLYFNCSSEFPTNSNNSSTGDLFSSDSEFSQTPPTQPTPPPTPPKLLYSQSTPKILNTQDHELPCPECDTLLDWSRREFDASADGSTDDYVTFGIDVEEAVREMRFLICRKTLLTASAGEWRQELSCTDHDYDNNDGRKLPRFVKISEYLFTNMPVTL